MFGQSNKDDEFRNTEDPQDNGGFVSSAHPDPTGAPEPPTLDAPEAPAVTATEPTAPASTDSDTPQFGQPFTPGLVLPATENTEEKTEEDIANIVTATPGNPVADDELIDIKKEALQQLTPLVGHLNQTPEEKFKTTMMMIQAADDQTLVKSAYESAQQIADDTARAQALLDIVNEINYFTQHENKLV